MIQACKTQYGASYTAAYHDAVHFDAYSWYCTNHVTGPKSIDVDRYCKWAYGRTAYADPQGGHQYDWGCYYS